jgi:ABC-type polysaccharide/polyol phosphate export permease
MHIWQIILQLFFWATPVVYPLATVPERYHAVIFLNPLAGIIHNSRLVLIDHQLPSLGSVLLTFAISGMIFAIGYSIFIKRAPYFAEDI